MSDVEELERALDFPWDKWTVFLHPAQRQMVERDYTGPARFSASAGTGKTVVALHRAVYLAKRFDEGRVLPGTFSDPLSHPLRNSLFRRVSHHAQLAARLVNQQRDRGGVRMGKA